MLWLLWLQIRGSLGRASKHICMFRKIDLVKAYHEIMTCVWRFFKLPHRKITRLSNPPSPWWCISAAYNTAATVTSHSLRSPRFRAVKIPSSAMKWWSDGIFPSMIQPWKELATTGSDPSEFLAADTGNFMMSLVRGRGLYSMKHSKTSGTRIVLMGIPERSQDHTLILKHSTQWQQPPCHYTHQPKSCGCRGIFEDIGHKGVDLCDL